MPDFLLRQPKDTKEYVVFLSSGNDLMPWRDRTERLIAIANQQLRDQGIICRLYADRWEHDAGHRVEPAGVNDRFIQRALDSHLTIVLLRGEIGTGTLGEFDAVLNQPQADTQLAVIWFDHDSPLSGTAVEVGRYLAESAANQKLIYVRPGPCESDAAWFAVVAVILRCAISATARTFTTSPEPTDAIRLEEAADEP